MFTGLIECVGTLLRVDQHGPDATMVIKTQRPLEGLSLGESIAVDGACLTVVTFHANTFGVDASAETLSRTVLGRKRTGSRVNIERALRLGDRLGGHLVSGHVDGIGTLEDRHPEGRSLRLFFAAPEDLTPYIIEKGSIAINGISLTINGCQEALFDVNIVPHTARETTIGELKVGDQVNLETDLVGKYIEKMLKNWKLDKPSTESRINLAFLKKHGYTG
jgi:riboflavin synthase